MRRLEVFDIRRKPKFFSWYFDPFDCTYHIEQLERSLKIYAEYNINCEAQYLYLFELVKGPDGFTLKFFSEHDVDAVFIPNDKERAFEIVIGKIIDKTTLGENWEKRHPEEKDQHLAQKEELKKVLKEKIEAFIG